MVFDQALMHIFGNRFLLHRLPAFALVGISLLMSSNGSWPVLLGQTNSPIRGSFSEGTFWIGFQTQSPWHYCVEHSTNLSYWETLVANIPGNDNEHTIADPASITGQGIQFYRVRRYSGRLLDEPPGNPAPIHWVWISPGTFTLGSGTNAAVREPDEQPVTLTTLSNGFWMNRHEVTQLEYLALTGANPSWFTNNLNQPVENVSWNDATNYCALLTAREQAEGRLPADFIYRLPTEAEWEYTCRAASTSSHAYGEDLAGLRLGLFAWYWDNSGSTSDLEGLAYSISGKYYRTQPVGTRQPNRWGLFDLHGSVWEWCHDWYGPYQGGIVVNPTGPRSGTARVIRGGSWNSGPDSCRSANRSAAFPGVRSNGIGFRVVLARRS